MPRADTEDPMKKKKAKQFTTLQELEESFGIFQSENNGIQPVGQMDTSEQMIADYGEENFDEKEKVARYNEIILEKLKHFGDETTINGAEKIADSENLKTVKPLTLMERKSLKIRYTRQYLLDHKTDPLSIEFPDSLLKFLHSREVPLKEEDTYDSRRMDHILFYTSLPYTRMRNSLSACAKRKPFNLCY